MASIPSRTGIRVSITTASGCSRTTAMTTSGAVGGFADGGVGLVLQDLAQPDPGGHYLRAALTSDKGIAATGRRCEWAAEVGMWGEGRYRC